jgi:hypothetical protein
VGTRNGPRHELGIREITNDGAVGGNHEPPGRTRERRHEHRGLRTFEYLEPGPRHRIVLDPLDSDVHGAAAADTEAEERILFEVVRGDHGFTCGDDPRSGCRDGWLEASSGK